MRLQRLSRAEAILGEKAIDTLSSSTVLIAGLGGVGGHALDALARSGVKHFILIDADKFEESNLNRQLLSNKNEIGNYKTDSAVRFLKQIDESIVVEAYPLFIDQSNIDTFLSMKPTVVVDAIDSVDSKISLIAKCFEKNIPVVSSMGAALRVDPTQIKTCDISKTSGDRLAKIVRTQLRKLGISKGLPCVYSTEQAVETKGHVLGSIETVTGCFGLTLAKLAIDSILSNQT